jgi:hypothetical protein
MLDYFKTALSRRSSLSTYLCRGLRPKTGGFSAISLAILAALSSGNLPAQPVPPGAARPVTAVVTNYHGWSKAILLSNGRVEALVVPEAGRVMQFRLAGSADGPFWENPKLAGAVSSTTNWNTPGAIGGDKSWPSPQTDWPRHTPWSPPFGFDGNPYSFAITNGVVTITSGVDADFQIQVTRTIALDPEQPVMRINTVFQRVNSTSMTNKPVSVWTITQVKDAAGFYVPVPAQSIYGSVGYVQLGRGLPAQFSYTNGMISMTRDPAADRHLGFDGDALVWVGTNCVLRIDAPRAARATKASYANNGCNTVIYTNHGADAPYVELECFGPLTPLLTGQSTSFTTTYTLFNRTETNPETQARKVLNLPATP